MSLSCQHGKLRHVNDYSRHNVITTYAQLQKHELLLLHTNEMLFCPPAKWLFKSVYKSILWSDVLDLKGGLIHWKIWWYQRLRLDLKLPKNILLKTLCLQNKFLYFRVKNNVRELSKMQRHVLLIIVYFVRWTRRWIDWGGLVGENKRFYCAISSF